MVLEQVMADRVKGQEQLRAAAEREMWSRFMSAIYKERKEALFTY